MTEEKSNNEEARISFSSNVDVKSVHVLTVEEHQFRGIASAFILVLLGIYLVHGFLRYKRQ